MPLTFQSYRAGRGSEKDERTKQAGTGNLARIWNGASSKLKGVIAAIYPFTFFFPFYLQDIQETSCSFLSQNSNLQNVGKPSPHP
jgi:hypothetical protein